LATINEPHPDRSFRPERRRFLPRALLFTLSPSKGERAALRSGGISLRLIVQASLVCHLISVTTKNKKPTPSFRIPPPFQAGEESAVRISSETPQSIAQAITPPRYTS
jgi:hypothetical protein